MSITDLLRSGYTQPVPRGAFIFHENDQGAEMYIVLKGSVEIFMNSNNQKITLAEITPGGFFGEMSLLEGHCRTASAYTTSNSILLIVTKKNFDEVISKAPQVALRIMQGLSSRIRELNMRLKQTITVEERQVLTGEGEPGAFSQGGTAVGVTQPVPIECGPEVIKETHFDLLLHKKFTCPVCGKVFKSYIVKESKLKQVRRTEELRVIYDDIDPLFYTLVMCPDCYYARKHDEFAEIDEISRKKLIATINDRKSGFSLDQAYWRTLGFIIQTYRVAIECYECLGKRNLDGKIAGLLLNLSWLYDLMEITGEAVKAKSAALNKYKNAYIMGSGGEEQDHKIEYLIGRLSWDRAELKEAREYTFKAATRQNGHSLLKQMAQDLLEEIKTAE